MAKVNCASCEELKKDAPSAVVNGLGTTEVASLKNNTGLNPSAGNDDCTDLNNLNDCLIGNMEEEVKLYDVCDWQEFMSEFIPNIYNVDKGIIAAICGLWAQGTYDPRVDALITRVTNVERRISDMCKLMDQTTNPYLPAFGTLPLATSTTRRCGAVTDKVIKMPDDGSLNPNTKTSQNFGLAYASTTVQSCTTGNEEMVEWIAPSHYLYKLASGAESGDILWRISKSQAQSVIGISDYLWTIFTQSSWTWYESRLTPSRQTAWLKLTVGTDGLGTDEMGIIFQGCSAPNTAITADQTFASFNNSSARVYKHNV